MKFVAIDFETANNSPDSACSLGVVRVVNRRIVESTYRLIRPPRRTFTLSWIHHLTWEDVEHESAFGEVWQEVRPLLKGADFIAAHNAGFDQRVLNTCCARARVRPPEIDFVCTMKLARDVLGFRKYGLEHVCKRLGIHLEHHHALSDARASARIVMAGARRMRQKSPGATILSWADAG
jgi:DNA polymerase III subunit epsilon